MRADVTLVSPYPAGDQPGQSGVAWYSRSLAQALAGAGAGVTVVAPGDRDRLRTESDGPVRVDRCFERGPAGALKAAAAARATGSPVVHVQHEAFLYGGPDSVPAVLYALARLRSSGRGPVVTMHQVVDPATVDRGFTEIHRVNIPPPVARAGLATLQSSVGRIAARVIVHEEAFRRVLPEASVLPLGANAAPETGGRVERRAAELRAAALGERAAVLAERSDRTEHPERQGPLLVLCFGFVAPYKGLEVALDAAALAGPDVRLVVAGGEHPRLGGRGYLDDLRSRYPDAAHFTGFVPDSDVTPWFNAADVVLLPYPQPFSSSGVLADAFTHEVPVLVSPPLAGVIGFPDEATVPLDPVLLSARLRELAADRSVLARVHALTSSHREGRSWAELAGRHLALYEEVIDAQRSSRWTARHRSRR